MKHDWTLLGGSGGWSVWICERCNRTAVPNVFGGLWADWLRRIAPWRFGCR